MHKNKQKLASGIIICAVSTSVSAINSSSNDIEKSIENSIRPFTEVLTDEATQKQIELQRLSINPKAQHLKLVNKTKKRHKNNIKQWWDSLWAKSDAIASKNDHHFS